MLDSEGLYHVILIDNYIFTAGLICFCKNEYEYMFNSLITEERQMKFFTVKQELLQPYLKD